MAKSRLQTGAYKTRPCARLWDPILRLSGPRTESHQLTVGSSALHTRKSGYPTKLGRGTVGPPAEHQAVWQHPSDVVWCAATISNDRSKDQPSSLLPQWDPRSCAG